MNKKQSRKEYEAMYKSLKGNTNGKWLSFYEPQKKTPG